MNNIIVTGGAGFIGCHVVKHHLEKGDRVMVLDNLSRRGTDINLRWLMQQEGEFYFVHTDIRSDRDQLAKLCTDADIIYHLAAQVAVTTSVEDPRTDFDINALGTFNVLEAARHSNHDPIIIYASTNKVYGGLENLEVSLHEKRYCLPAAPQGVSESRTLDFHSPYGCSKGSGDQYCRDYHRIYGLRTVVLRQSCIYGTRQFGVEDQGWIAHFIISSIFKRPLTIYGDGMQVRDVLWIDDLIECYLAALGQIEKTAGKIYNIGGGTDFTLSLLELITLLEDELQKNIDYSFADWRPGDQKVYISDVSLAKQEFGWQPHTKPRAGISKLLAWVSANRDELARVFIH